jgi:peptidoglycan/LPS O-acetylase OafA/YrhL
MPAAITVIIVVMTAILFLHNLGNIHYFKAKQEELVFFFDTRFFFHKRGLPHKRNI